MSTYKKIFNEFFGLEEIHKYNTIIKELDKPTLSVGRANDVLELLNGTVYVGSNLNDYVEGSDKYNEIKEKLELNAKIKTSLRDFSYKCEKLLDETSLVKTIELFKHTISYDTVLPICGWEYDEETGEEYEVCVDNDVTVTEFFYTSSYHRNIVEDLSEMFMPYDTPDGRYKSDGNHIQRHLDEYWSLRNILEMRKQCDKLEFDFSLFCQVFDITKLEFEETYVGEIYGFIQDDVRYSLKDVKQMLVNAKIAINFKVKGYVCNDEYVHYPRYVKYVDFLKNHLNITHFPVKV